MISTSNRTPSPKVATRIGLWFGCGLLVVLCLCALLGPSGSIDVALRIALVFILPVWLLCLPLIFRLRDAEHRRIWILLAAGLVAGPAVLALWFVMGLLQGGSAHQLWQGDPDVPGMTILMILSSVFTLVLTAIYSASLKMFRPPETPPSIA